MDWVGGDIFGTEADRCEDHSATQAKECFLPRVAPLPPRQLVASVSCGGDMIGAFYSFSWDLVYLAFDAYAMIFYHNQR